MVLKECCGKCGFPVDMERKPVLITNSIISFIEYEENVCEECGHQKDGTTIPIVYEHWQSLANKFITERKELTKFLHKYAYLTELERKGVCVMLPRFMRPSYKSTGDNCEDDIEEPYSWNVVYHEVINNTDLSRVMVRDIDWEKIEK